MTSKYDSNTEYYNPMVEHSQDDITKVKRAANEEQQRRIKDVIGEQQKRNNAYKVSEIITTNLRPNWFQQGTTYAFNILQVARDAGNKALRSSQVRAVSARLQIAGQKGVATAQDVKHRVEVVGSKAQEKAQETSQDVKLKLQEVAQKLKNVSLKVFGKVSQAFTNLSENTNLAFAVLEEEGERTWRLNSETEAYAILNALRVSSLIKETAPALYRPAFEPTRKYSTRLLEENERARRSTQDLIDFTALNNAKAISLLIANIFRTTPAPLPIKEKSKAAQPTKVNTPSTAAM
jgi:hypothetical protein